MKKLMFICVLLALALCSLGCVDDAFGHEIFTDINDYSKVFELPEIRFCEVLELFPEKAEGLNTKDFYFEWELGIVGSAKIELSLSVEYNEKELNEEIARLKSLADGKTVYDTESFEYPAYVVCLGNYQTSCYALIDAGTVHYVYVSLIYKSDMDINRNFLPKGYRKSGEVVGQSYNIYWDE